VESTIRREDRGLGSNNDVLPLLLDFARERENLIQETRVLQGAEYPCPYHLAPLLVFVARSE